MDRDVLQLAGEHASQLYPCAVGSGHTFDDARLMLYAWTDVVHDDSFVPESESLVRQAPTAAIDLPLRLICCLILRP
jgi:hypothetical protein